MGPQRKRGRKRMRIGFLQLRPRFGEVRENVRKAATILNKISDATIVLPELFNVGYLFRNEEEIASLAEAIPGGYTVSEMRKLAERKRLNLVFGMAQKHKGAYYNAAVFVSSKGKIEVYRKVHLFDREKLFFTRGSSFKTVSAGDARLGLLVCYDWVFPEVSRILALDGAQILCHPSNLVLPYAQDAMRTRCIENRVFAITANRIGSEHRGAASLTFTGGSQIVDPAGRILASAGDRSESLRVVEIDVAEADDKHFTPNNHLFKDRAPRLYASLARTKR